MYYIGYVTEMPEMAGSSLDGIYKRDKASQVLCGSIGLPAAPKGKPKFQSNTYYFNHANNPTENYTLYQKR
jgi:hypothetical protein